MNQKELVLWLIDREILVLERRLAYLRQQKQQLLAGKDIENIEKVTENEGMDTL